MIAFSLIFWLGFVCFFGFLLGFAFRFVLGPLAIPKTAQREFKRERLLSYLLFFSLGFSTLALPLLGIVYLIGLIRHIRNRSALAGASQPDSARIIPRFVLSELLLMVFGLGILPLIVQALALEKSNDLAAGALYGGFAVFPACYLCALYRLNFHNIPSCGRRSLILVLTPYCALSIASLAIGTLIMLFAGYVHLQPQFFVWLAACVAVVIVTRVTASQLADEAADAKYRAAMASPPPPEAPPAAPPA